MSLLDAIKECEKDSEKNKNENIDQLNKLHYFDLISKNEFDIKSKPLSVLIDALYTYNYLCLDTNDLVAEILWLIGEDKKEFLKYFAVIVNDENCTFNTFMLREDLNCIIKNEFKKYLKK